MTKDRDLIRTVIPAALRPDGEVNVDGLTKDLAFIKTLGLVKSNEAVTDIVDMSFAKAAAALQGAYRVRDVPLRWLWRPGAYQILWSI